VLAPIRAPHPLGEVVTSLHKKLNGRDDANGWLFAQADR